MAAIYGILNVFAGKKISYYDSIFIGNGTALVHVMACPRKGDKPLSRITWTHMYAFTRHHYGLMQLSVESS